MINKCGSVEIIYSHHQETWWERSAVVHWISALDVGSPQVKCLPVGSDDSRKDQQKRKSLAAGTDFDGPKYKRSTENVKCAKCHSVKCVLFRD